MTMTTDPAPPRTPRSSLRSYEVTDDRIRVLIAEARKTIRARITQPEMLDALTTLGERHPDELARILRGEEK